MKELLIKYGNRTIYGMLSLPEGVENPAIVICSHGYNGNHEGFNDYSNKLLESGIASYFFDFCGGSVNSKSSMLTTEMTLDTEVDDLLAIFDYFSNSDLVDKNRIYLLGESQGGLISARTAAQLGERVKSLYLIFPALCIADNWNERFASIDEIPDEFEFWGMKLGKNFFLNLRDIDVYTEITKYRNKVLIFHGENDEIVPVEYSKRACKEYEEAKLEIYPNEGHGFSKKIADLVIDKIIHDILN